MSDLFVTSGGGILFDFFVQKSLIDTAATDARVGETGLVEADFTVQFFNAGDTAFATLADGAHIITEIGSGWYRYQIAGGGSVTDTDGMGVIEVIYDPSSLPSGYSAGPIWTERFIVGQILDADMVRISGDSAAAANLEAMFDGGGYVNGKAPATQDGLAAVSAFVDTEVAAIKAKTDNLPTDPADASDIAAAFSTVNSTLTTIANYIDTEVAAIKAKTDNLPSDPADASDIATAFSGVNTKLDTISNFVDTEVGAIKAKTDNLPSDPADASVVAGLIAAVEAKVDTVDGVVDAIKVKTDNLPSDPADQSAVEAAITAATSPLATAAAVTAVAANVTRSLGLLHENSLDDNHEYDPDTGDLLSVRKRVFASKAAANAATIAAANNSDSEVARYTLQFTYSSGKLASFKWVRDL